MPAQSEAVSESPWQRPEAKEAAPVQSMVSPYAPTVPQETYKPVPGDPIYEAFAKKSETSKTATKSPTHPEAPQRSVLPVVLITVGILAVLAAILLWLLH